MSDFSSIAIDYQHLRLLLDPTLPEDLSHVDDIDAFAHQAFAEIVQKQTAEILYLRQKHPQLFSENVCFKLDDNFPQDIQGLLDRNKFLNDINAFIIKQVVDTLEMVSQTQKNITIQPFKLSLKECGITRFPIGTLFQDEQKSIFLMNLVSLDCSDNQLTDLDLRPFTNLKTAICTNNEPLRAVYLSGLSSLERLEIDENNPNLLTLEMEGVPLSIKQKFDLPVFTEKELPQEKSSSIFSEIFAWNPFSYVWSWLSWFIKEEDDSSCSEEQTNEYENNFFEKSSKSEDRYVEPDALNVKPTPILFSVVRQVDDSVQQPIQQAAQPSTRKIALQA